jgi:hypothetical protein
VSPPISSTKLRVCNPAAAAAIAAACAAAWLLAAGEGAPIPGAAADDDDEAVRKAAGVPGGKVDETAAEGVAGFGVAVADAGFGVEEGVDCMGCKKALHSNWYARRCCRSSDFWSWSAEAQLQFSLCRGIFAAQNRPNRSYQLITATETYGDR